jgi:genome maintenance exonuclease 1
MSEYYSTVENFKEKTGYEIDGIWYPRVTSIVSIKAKPALYKYYASLPSFAAGEAIKNKSAEEGTLLHETVESILKGEDKEIPETIKPAVMAFLDFKKQNEIIPHKIEERLVSKKHHYAGTLDCLAELNGQLGVLDIKTSLAIYRDYGIQTSAYVEALAEDPSMPPLKRWILRIDQARACIKGCGAKMRDKGGNVKIRGDKGKVNDKCPHVWGDMTGDIELKELPGQDKDIAAFLASKVLWEWENEFWLSKVKNGQKKE